MSFFDELLNQIFPPSCFCCDNPGTFLCRKCKRDILKCSFEQSILSNFGSHYFYFRNINTVKKLIKKAKIDPSFKTFQFLIQLMNEKLLFIPEDLLNIDYIVPIPNHFTSLWKRGFSPAYEISYWIHKRTQTEIVKDAIKFQKSVNKQALLNQRSREENMKNAFKVNINCTNKNFLIVDDIFTTGNTILSAKNALLENGANRVYSLSMAWSPFKGS